MYTHPYTHHTQTDMDIISLSSRWADKYYPTLIICIQTNIHNIYVYIYTICICICIKTTRTNINNM